MEVRFALCKVLGVALIVAAVLGARHIHRDPLATVTNPRTGIRMPYPARWEEAESRELACRADEKAGGISVIAPPGGPTARLLSVPREIWPESDCPLPSAPDLLAPAAACLGFSGPVNRVTVSPTVLLGCRGLLLSGPRRDGSWAGLALAVDGDRLLLFLVVAPNREKFLGFEPVWRRMIRRARRVGEPQPWDGVVALPRVPLAYWD